MDDPEPCQQETPPVSQTEDHYITDEHEGDPKQESEVSLAQCAINPPEPTIPSNSSLQAPLIMSSTPVSEAEVHGGFPSTADYNPSSPPDSLARHSYETHIITNSLPSAKRAIPADDTYEVKRIKKEPTAGYDEQDEDLSVMGVYSPEYDRAVNIIREIRTNVMRGYDTLETAGHRTNEAKKMRSSFSRITIDSNDIRQQLSIAFMGRMESGMWLLALWSLSSLTTNRQVILDWKYDQFPAACCRGKLNSFSSTHLLRS